MPYQKPGVEITQEIRTNSPVLSTPELEGCLIGTAYHWQNPLLDSAILATELTTVNNSFTTSGANEHFYEMETGDEALVVVSLIGIRGTDTGTVKHLKYGSQYSASNNIVTISGSAMTVGSTYKARVGFRAKNTNNYGFNKLVSLNDLTDTLGEPVTANPLAYAVSLAIKNSGKEVWAYKSNYTEDLATVIDSKMDTKNFHKVAIMKHLTSGEVSAIKTKVENRSLAENKKETVVFVNKSIDYPTALADITAGELDTLAETIRDANSTVNSKRVFSLSPSWGYVVEARHIGTLKYSWIKQSFKNFTSDFDNSPSVAEKANLYARLTGDLKINGILYKKGSPITDALWTLIVDNNLVETTGKFTAYVPVPGFYYAATVLGRALGLGAASPLTNLDLSGIDFTVGSQDLFSEANLNKMASGGTWVIAQKNESTPIYTRHQLSTNNLSIVEREFSITNAVDYTARFVRERLEPEVGKNNINDAFIDSMSVVLKGIGDTLVNKLKYLKDFKIIKIQQNELNPDTLDIEISVAVLYPANYIKIVLTV